jgi:large-conductance mechanosensitive channel
MKTRFIFLILSCSVFIGCKTPQKTITETKQSERRNIENDVLLLNESDLSEIVSRAIQTAISEKLNLSLNQKIYDTDKPIDAGTGKPPLKEENNINLSKETDMRINDSIEAAKHVADKSLSADKTKGTSQVNAQAKTEEETKMPGWQKIALGIIAVLILALIAFLITNLKKWKPK